LSIIHRPFPLDVTFRIEFFTKPLQLPWLHVALSKPVGSALADAVRVPARMVPLAPVRFFTRDRAQRPLIHP